MIFAIAGGNISLSSSMKKLRPTQAEKFRVDNEPLWFLHHRNSERNVGEDGIETAAFSGVFIWLSIRGSLRSALWGVKVKDVAQDRRGIAADESRFLTEFGNSGVIFGARYTDRRIKRIFEDRRRIRS